MAVLTGSIVISKFHEIAGRYPMPSEIKPCHCEYSQKGYRVHLHPAVTGGGLAWVECTGCRIKTMSYGSDTDAINAWNGKRII